MGILPKRILSQCHPAFSELLPWYYDEDDERHGNSIKQLREHDREVIFQGALFECLIEFVLAMIHVYDTFAKQIVDSSSVKVFQHRLTQVAGEPCTLQYTFDRRQCR